MKFFYLAAQCHNEYCPNPRMVSATNKADAMHYAKQLCRADHTVAVMVYRMKWSTYKSTGGNWDYTTFKQFAKAVALIS